MGKNLLPEISSWKLSDNNKEKFHLFPKEAENIIRIFIKRHPNYILEKSTKNNLIVYVK